MTCATRAWVAGCALALATVPPRTGALVGAAAPQLPPRDVAVARQSGAIIRGVVVDGATGTPIRRAAVSLVIEQPDRESSRVLATTADGAGQFEFTGVPAARVQITAARTGYFDYDNLWNGEPEEPQWQTVASGQRIQGVRIALYRGGAITGRIVDEFGEPAAGIEIDVLRREPGDAGGAVRTTSMSLTPTTDDTGAFRVWGLAPGDYIVGARPNRFVAETPGEAAMRREGYSATYYPGTAVLSNARAVRVTAGRDTGGVAFGLVTVPLATIRGTVLLPPDTPGRGVSLGVSLVAPQRLDGYVTRSVRPRDDGSFELTRLAPGSYRVTARQFQQSGVEYYGTADIEVNGNDVDGVTVAMRRGAIVRGRVVSERGEPVGVPVMVSLVPADGDRAPMARPARTYSDGSFRIEGAFGAQRVQAVEARVIPGAESPGINVRTLQDVTPASRALSTWWLTSIALNGRDVTDEPIDFDQGDAMLDITMTNRTAIVRGTVSWAPAAGRRRPAVVVFADDDSRWRRPTRVVGTGEVDDSGRFEVRGLPPGDRYLAVAVEGVSRAVLARPEMLAAVRSAATSLRVDEGGIHDLSLRAIARPAP